MAADESTMAVRFFFCFFLIVFFFGQRGPSVTWRAGDARHWPPPPTNGERGHLTLSFLFITKYFLGKQWFLWWRRVSGSVATFSLRNFFFFFFTFLNWADRPVVPGSRTMAGVNFLKKNILKYFEKIRFCDTILLSGRSPTSGTDQIDGITFDWLALSTEESKFWSKFSTVVDLYEFFMWNIFQNNHFKDDRDRRDPVPGRPVFLWSHKILKKNHHDNQ